jgi:predicted transcriptional regulator
MATNRNPTSALPTPVSPRKGTKLHGILKQLQAPRGTTLDRMVKATSWQAHTVRASLTRLRQQGYAIERTQENGKSSRYRLVDDA